MEGDNNLRIAGIIRESIVDGPGIRLVVFAQGCPHRCEGCHNPNTHDFNGGYLCQQSKILQAIEADPLLSGITFSGGDPFCQPDKFWELGVSIRKLNPQLDLLAFTGYTLEEIEKMAEQDPYVDLLMKELDFLIDGPFILKEKDLSLPFRGSRNQRFIDVKATLKKGEPVELNENNFY